MILIVNVTEEQRKALRDLGIEGLDDHSGSSHTYCPHCEEDCMEEMDSDWMDGSYTMKCEECGRYYEWNTYHTREECTE